MLGAGSAGVMLGAGSAGVVLGVLHARSPGIFTTTPSRGTVSIAVLQKRKWRLRQVGRLAQGHLAYKWQSWD